MTKEEYQEYEKAVSENTKGFHYCSSGYCPGCPECENFYGTIDDGENYPDIDPSFSWHSCEICGSHLGGDRYPAHTIDDDENIVHFEACVDCVYYLEYGHLDDLTMMEIEENDGN
jgi:hypothetical protein